MYEIPFNPEAQPESRLNEYKNIDIGPLYALASNGKIKYWRANVINQGSQSIITYTFGYDDGVHQHQEKIIDIGKNIGKSNETTHFQQACKDAESKANKKMDEGYCLSKTELTTPILPMLAHPYTKRSHNIKWPCYVQPKIDGVRCTLTIKNGKVKMFTRKGKEFTPMPSLVESILEWQEHAKSLPNFNEDLYLDGELYSDTLTFQELAGTLRRHKNTEEVLDQIYFVVFDSFQLDWDTPYLARKAILEEQFEHFNDPFLKLIETTEVIDEAEMKERHQKYIQQGYEGTIIRNKDAFYKLKHRSPDLQKYKDFIDAEFTIINFKDGEGTEEGCVIWECETSNGKRFFVRPKGTRESRQTLFNEGNKYLGEQLTVRYQELTDDGIPRFPVGISVRNYE